MSVSEAARSIVRPVRPYRPPLGHPMEAPVRKQQMRPNKEEVFTNDEKKPNKTKQAEKLKSREMKEGWMKNDEC